MKSNSLSATPSPDNFLTGKTAHSLALYDAFLSAFGQAGTIRLHPTKTMIGIAGPAGNMAWITALGKDFLHVVFPFPISYTDNLCFQKIARVPGGSKQFNHHFRMYRIEDINEEIRHFMQLAYNGNK